MMRMEESRGSGRLEALSDEDLVRGFRAKEVPGRAVMSRLLDRIDMGHRQHEQLLRRDGTPLTTDEGVAILAEDYLDIAGEHPGAVNAILGFMTVDESHPKYQAFKGVIGKVVAGYLPPEETT